MKRSKFGVILQVEGSVTGGKPEADLVLRMAENAELLGYRSVWVGDRLLITPRLEPFSTLGAIAARTRTVQIGTAVLLAPLRNPVLLAHMVASLDVLSGGRTILGVGVGARRIASEYAAVQVKFGQRGRMLDECITILKRLWSEDKVTFGGKYYQLQNVALPLKPKQRNGPPLWIGGFAENALRRAGELGDGWSPIEIEPKHYEEGIKRVLDYAAKRDRPASSIHKAFYMTANVNEDRDRARTEAQNFLNSYYDAAVSHIEKFGVFGTVDDCIRRIEQYAAAGVETMIVRFASFSPLDQADVFARRVAPSF